MGIDNMRRLVLPLGIVLAVLAPLLIGWMIAGWLVSKLVQDLWWSGVVGMTAAIILGLLSIAGWAMYKDNVWQGFMHPLPFMGSVVLVLIALLALPSLWGQLRLLAEGDGVQIVYLADRPSYSLPELAVESDSRLRRVFMYL